MKRRPVMSTLLISATVVALAACSSSSKSSTATTTATTTTVAATTSTPSTTAAAGSTTVAKSPTATLRVVTNSKLGKQIIVNSAGRTVYMYVPDGSSTTSKVPAALAALWPPVVVSGAVIAGPGLTAAKLASARQADGSTQVAYNGHLLYTFSNDKAAGDATGQALGNVWYVLTPAGVKAS
jgi:predicted lipoprotein with Yx(FWY)xxD motif